MKFPVAGKTLLAALTTALVLTFATAMPVSQVQAAETEQAEKRSEKTKKRRVRRAQTLRPQIFKKLDAARALADEKKYTEALEELQALEKRKRNSYEKAMTHNMYAYVYFNQENYDAAISAYEKVVGFKKIPESLEQGTLYSLAKLQLMQERYAEALTPLNQWFELVEKPGAEAHILRAQIYFQLEQFQQALPDVKAAIAQVKAQGNNPRENWLMLERAVYYQNKDFNNLARCLQDLATLYPKSQYWVQLAAVYSELGQPLKELSALEAAHEQGLLNKENELVNLAQALLAQEVPYKAANILAEGMKSEQIEVNARNLSLLGDAWMIAKEYDNAIKVMSQAARMSGKGKDFYKLAQIHTERQEWTLALNNVDAALQDSDFNKQADAQILRGLVLFNLDNLADAQGAFEAAAEFKSSEKMAAQWLAYIEGERKRREYMAGTL
ncbi:tetratricopeptide repeat protein [Bacterioplanoides pacificum]|uniref:Tetratricopeptide repeat protein n=1 Tax=Bacterioplanoides pacificum TaxID=1171596 RepID=A0ABV7VN96_9GAMM